MAADFFLDLLPPIEQHLDMLRANGATGLSSIAEVYGNFQGADYRS